MNQYKVTGSRTVKYCCYVEAENEDDAIEIAEEEGDWEIDEEAMEMNIYPPDIYGVEEI